MISTIQISRLAEKSMVSSYQEMGTYLAEYNAEPGAIYFGASSGIFRMTPAQQYEECGEYDPRRRPWYNAASSLPKDVVLIIDVSQSMGGSPLLIAQAAALSIIGTLTAADRVAVIAASSTEASSLLEGNMLIQATEENKMRLAEAIEALGTSGSSNWYNAFNLTFDVLGNSISTNVTTPCNSAIILLTDGTSDEEGQMQEETSNVTSLVQEKREEIASTFNKKSFLFVYSVGENADTSLTKNFACSTGGLWKHLGNNEIKDILSALSSYYKLFAMGLEDGDYTDFSAWVGPYQYEIESRIGATVSVPVFDCSVTPYELLGVVGVDMSLGVIEQVFGSNATAWFQDWVTNSSVLNCQAIDPTECQLDALRALGGGEDATCRSCNNTSSDVKEVCPLNSTVPTDLWQNTQNEGKPYAERSCCESDMSVPSELCPIHSTESNDSNEVSLSILVISVTISIVSAFAL